MRKAAGTGQLGLYLREYNSGPYERQRNGGLATAAWGPLGRKCPQRAAACETVIAEYATAVPALPRPVAGFRR